MIPLIPIALGIGGLWWWKKTHPKPVQAPQYKAKDGNLYNSPFLIDSNLPANIAQQIVVMVNEETDISTLSANQAWLAASGYPIAAKLLSEKIDRVKAASTHTTNGSVWGI